MADRSPLTNEMKERERAMVISEEAFQEKEQVVQKPSDGSEIKQGG